MTWLNGEIVKGLTTSPLNYLTTLLIFILLTLPAHAQQKRIFYATGTGFFLSAYGDFITNAHVVKDCRKGTISVQGAADSPAELVAINHEHDLALLRARKGTPDSARLAALDSSIHKGDDVMVIGYPKDRDNLRNYKVVFSEIVGVKGPQGEEEWLQFKDAAQKGNSGGPLLDEAGNVIGVVTGKTQLYQINPRTRTRTLVSASDVAVALPFLKRFLRANRVRYNKGDSRARRSPKYVEQRAANFIAQVTCITSEERVR